MGTTTIRAATATDYPVFAELFLELGVDDPVATPERFESEMLATTLIAERDGAIVGYAFYRRMKSLVHVTHVVTAPSARRSGVGRALMTAVASRARTAGRSMLSLNVLATNAAAIALYESFGLARIYASRGLRMDWAVIDALAREDTPWVDDVRPIEPADYERLEQELGLPAGILAEQSARRNRILRTIPREPGRSAVAVFDPVFPGTYPIRAPDLPHVLSLLRALRSHARPEDPFVLIPIENQAEIADALVATGAIQRFEMVFMRGAI